MQTPHYPKSELVTLAPQPRAGATTLPAPDSASGYELRYVRANEAGVYVMRTHAPGEPAKTVFFARNAEPSEGDLAPGGKDALEAAFASKDFAYVRRQGASQAPDSQSPPSSESWTWALAAMLGLMAVESVLARRFGHYADSSPRGKRQETFR